MQLPTSPPSPTEELREHFSKYGDIESINVKTDPNTGRSRGFAFIVFSNTEAIDKVRSLALLWYGTAVFLYFMYRKVMVLFLSIVIYFLTFLVCSFKVLKIKIA